jgi:[protein-PII] uridylyltransferase
LSLLDLDKLNTIRDRGQLGKQIRSDYNHAWTTLKLEHETGRDSLGVVSQLTRLMDELIDYVYNRSVLDIQGEGLEPDHRLVLMALGSYGRKELSPHSDIDLLFLLPDKLTPWSKSFTERVLYTLWDTGLDVGYSTRSLGDCLTLASTNFDVLTSLLDARYLQGNLDLFNNFRKEFRRKVLNRVGNEFVMDQLKKMEDRLEKHGGTIYVLEPNLKEGMGGLRDIHTAMWVSKTLFGAESLEKLKNIKELDILDEKDFRQLQKSFDFLQQVRCELHFASNAARDLLSMERQPYLAERFGYKGRRGVPAVERFMQKYYTHAGQVHHITESIIKRSLERKRKTPRILTRWKEKDLGGGLYAREGAMYARTEPNEYFKGTPDRLMMVFKFFQETNLEFSPELSAAIRGSLKLVNNDFRRSRKIRDVFFSILSEDRRLYETLLVMNELRFLGKYIPEFAQIFCKMQHDYYHAYTVDEHSIRAIREIIELPESPDPVMGIYKKIYEEMSAYRHLLFLTLLLHDVGKGSGTNHAERGAKMAARAAKRMGISKHDIDDIRFLIQNHLVLSHVAQRRDLHEEKTITEVAALMGTSKRLKLLFLITMADLKAVGPGVLNEWKAGLIAELFLEANMAIERGGVFREDLLQKIEKERTEILKILSADFDSDHIITELDALSERAYMVYRPESLIHMIRLRLGMDDSPIATAWLQASKGGHTEFYIVSNDFPGLFSKIAGVLAANNVNILGAQILTRADGIVFDLLHVTDNVMKPINDKVKFRLVSRELEKVISGELTVEDLFHTRRLSLPLDRREKTALEAPTRVEIDNEVSEIYTVIDVYTTDRIGLLYTITSTLASMDLSIHTAKVSTKVDQAVDVFYVADLDGEKVMDEGALERIREELMRALAE